MNRSANDFKFGIFISNLVISAHSSSNTGICGGVHTSLTYVDFSHLLK